MKFTSSVNSQTHFVVSPFTKNEKEWESYSKFPSLTFQILKRSRSLIVIGARTRRETRHEETESNREGVDLSRK